MKNKTLATINILCIAFPMVLGAVSEITSNPQLANGALVGIGGLFMIIFGIWTSLRLGKQQD